MRSVCFFLFILLGWISFTTQAQEIRPGAYDYALMKREFLGKNDIFAVTYKNETGKIVRVEGYIRAASDESNIALYVFNLKNKNYDVMEIPIAHIQSIVKSGSQKTIVEDRKPVITAGGILKVAGTALIIAGVLLLIFHKEL